MTKKIVAALLAVCMIVTAAACGAGQAAGPGTGPQPAGEEKSETPAPEPAPEQGQEPAPPAPPAPSAEAGEAEKAAYALSNVTYTERASYPAEDDYIDPKTGEWDWDAYDKAYQLWQEQFSARLEAGRSYDGKLDNYLLAMIPALASAGEDLVYEGPAGEAKNYTASPLNIFMALGMLAEVTDSSSRQQILDLLGTGSLEETRALAKQLWDANYADDGVVKSILAASLWVNEDIETKDAALMTLAEYYYPSVWRGSATDAAFSRCFKDWLNEQAGGLLKDAVEQLKDFDEQMILTLATTVYFKAPWADKFLEGDTSEDDFHTDHGDVKTDFMHSSSRGTVYQGDLFRAVKLGFTNGGGMWIILPDEGVSPYELLAPLTYNLWAVKDGDPVPSIGERIRGGNAAQALLIGTDLNKFESQTGIVELSLPKFDVDATTDLKKVLQSMGVTDCFDDTLADFTPLTDVPAVVSDATHSARVKIDEEGVEAAAFTVMSVEASAAFIDPPRIEFNCNRPFVFAVTGLDGLPLFFGTVCDPQ